MYSYEKRIAASDVDETARQTLVSTVTLMQDCSLFSLDATPVFRDYLNDNNIAMMVVSRQLDILRRPAYGETVRVMTSIYGFKGFLGYRNTVVFDAQGEMVAKCYAVGAFVELDTGKLVKIPAEVTGTIPFADKIDMEYLPRKIAIPGCEPARLDPIPVAHNDIDLYRHMNNAQYVRVAFELLPEGAPCARMRVEHKAQARLGQSLYPLVYSADAGTSTCIVLADEAGEPYSVVEFS